MLTVLRSFLLSNKLAIAGILIILTLFFVNNYNYSRYKEQKQESERLQVNLNASTDTIRVIRAKDSTLSYQRLTYVAKDVDDLKKISIDLYNETKNLKGEVLNLQNAQLIIHTDTVPVIVKAEVNDSSINLTSKYDTNYSKGNYHHLLLNNTYNLKTGNSIGFLIKDEIGFTASTGILKTSKGYEIFVNPKYPGLKVNQLEGAIIDKNFFAPTPSAKTKQPLLNIGGSIGWTPLIYELNTKKFDFNPQRLGGTLGVTFNLFR